MPTLLIVIVLTFYFLVVIHKPHWGINLILVLLPIYQIRFTVFGLPTTFLEWMILLLAAAVAGKILLGNRSLRHRGLLVLKQFSQLNFIIGIFITASLLAVFVSPVPDRALGIFKAYIAEGVLFWLLCLLLLDSKQKLNQALYALGALVVYLALFGVFQFFTLYRLPPSWWGPGIEPRRVVSLFTYPNGVALLVTPILSLFTALLIFQGSTGKLMKKFRLTVLVLGLILLALTFSRGGWIGYALSVIFLMLYSPYKKQVLAFLLLAVAALALLPVSRHRLLPVITGTDPAGLERFKLYAVAGEIVRQQPILGAGLMGFRQWYTALRPSIHDDILNYPHNFFLNFWTETGLLGLLAILAMLIWTTRHAWNFLDSKNEHRPLALATLAALLALLAHGMVDVPFFKNDLSVFFWFLLAIIPSVMTLKPAQ